MPAYNRPDALPRTLDSLFSQTYPDFDLVIVDDRPTSEIAAIVERYSRSERRLRYEANSARLGMVGNWRKAFERARAAHPASEYFAWVSDHDVWHPRWLEEMVAVLDQQPEVVVAYPENLRMLEKGARLAGPGFQTFGMRSRSRRIRHAARHMLAGDMIYGLMRADALAAAGIFRRVITPDRQVLLALSLFGEIKQVPEVLWYREVLRPFDIQRQRDVFFPDGAPAYTRLSSHLQHCATLLWDFAVHGKGRPAFGRAAALWYAVLQLWFSYARDLLRPKANWRVALARFTSRPVNRPTEVGELELK
jgi:glycosyltransferase involved in cell wall biosynthesis